MKPSASSCSQNADSSSGPSPGSGDAEGWPRTGNVSTAKRSLSSSSLLFASCFESYAIQDDVPGQTLSTNSRKADERLACSWLVSMPPTNSNSVVRLVYARDNGSPGGIIICWEHRVGQLRRRQRARPLPDPCAQGHIPSG